MADGSNSSLFVSLGSVVVNLCVAIGAGVWALAHSRNNIDDKISRARQIADEKISLARNIVNDRLEAKEQALSNELAELERRLRYEIDETERHFGETVVAVKEHVRLIELWNRDNLASKVDFEDMKHARDRFEDQLNKRLDQINKKLDQVNGD